MLKKVIVFKDFDGNDRKAVAYFHITKTELTDLVANDVLDPDEMMQAGYTSDGKQMYKTIKLLVDASYGIRTEDGASFIKDEANLKRFKQSLAYDALIMSLLTGDEHSENSFLEFVKGVFPQDLLKEVLDSINTGKPDTPAFSDVSESSKVVPMVNIDAIAADFIRSESEASKPSPPLAEPRIDTEDPAFQAAVARAVEERMHNAVSGSMV